MPHHGSHHRRVVLEWVSPAGAGVFAAFIASACDVALVCGSHMALWMVGAVCQARMSAFGWELADIMLTRFDAGVDGALCIEVRAAWLCSVVPSATTHEVGAAPRSL